MRELKFRIPGISIWDGQKFFYETALKMRAAHSGNADLISVCKSTPIILTQYAPDQEYTTRQIACLVIHQFLCTLDSLPWMQDDGSPDFHIWFGTTSSNGLSCLVTCTTRYSRILIELRKIRELHHIRSYLCCGHVFPVIISDSSVYETHGTRARMISSLLGLSSGACCDLNQ
jgi:poly(ADP-ribose) glycohydrolase